MAQSPYVYAGDMPITAVDVNGDSTFVTKNDDGTYKVIGGTTEGNHNGIFIKNEDGTIGEMIGYSLTPQSFFCSDCGESGEWMGTIDVADQSGRDFLNDNFGKNGIPSIISYMYNGTAGKKYDFKRTGNGDATVYHTEEDYYRGMPIMDKVNNQRIYASARDVGNVGAGIVAGYNGMHWDEARAGFDGLETYQSYSETGTLKWKTETASTQYGQRVGMELGEKLLKAYEKQTNANLERVSGIGQLNDGRIPKRDCKLNSVR